MVVSEKQRSGRGELRRLEERFLANLHDIIKEHALTEAAMMYFMEKEKTKEGVSEFMLQSLMVNFADVVPEFIRRLHALFGDLEQSWEALKKEAVKSAKTAKQRKFVMNYVLEREGAVNKQKRKVRKLEKRLRRQEEKWQEKV